MYPNPQDALPLFPRPSLERYRTLAGNLVQACKTGEPDAVRTWALPWFGRLAATQPRDKQPGRDEISQYADKVAAFAATKLPGADGRIRLRDAQFVLARMHGFTSWATFAKHLQALAQRGSRVAAYERAADAIVNGDLTALKRLLRKEPSLARMRSLREHRSTLLHYVSANGVEGYRQKSPKNAVAIARALLDAGADVDAPADVYGGGSTTLGLAATSGYPEVTGVQNDLLDLLVAHGARLDHRSGAGNQHNLVNGCLANGCKAAAEHLAALGATLDLEGAAGVGRLDLVKQFVSEAGRLRRGATRDQLYSGFAWACEYGRLDVVEFLLPKGIDLRAPVRPHHQTPLHWAAWGGHRPIVRLLIAHGAPLDAVDRSFNATPLSWALYAWSSEPQAAKAHYYDVVAQLVAAGATIDPVWMSSKQVQKDAPMRAALRQ